MTFLSSFKITHAFFSNSVDNFEMARKIWPIIFVLGAVLFDKMTFAKYKKLYVFKWA